MTDTAELIARLKPVAWLHPTADWAHKSHGYVAAHCTRGGPRPLPLYQIDADALSSLVRERDELRGDNEMLTKGGIIEVAIRNFSVADYMRHWEARATAAEADAARMREALGQLLSSVDAALCELKPGQALSPAGAGRTNALIADRNSASASLSNTSEGGKGE